MSRKNSYLSPQNYKRNKIIFHNTNFPKLEEEIFKLINYLRINPEKYFNEFNNFFLSEEKESIEKEINEYEAKLYPFIIQKEISNAGNDYLNYLIENTSDKLNFNFKNVDKTCFNLRARLSKYGQRYGKIFESVILNSNCAEEIVNKLIKDDKARKMILSPNMKYIAITCGFIPKWNNICTIIDIVQNFIAYKDIDNISYNNNDIQIINTIELDEKDISENKSLKDLEQKDKINKIKNKYCSKTCKLKNKSNKKGNIFISIDNNFYKNNNNKSNKVDNKIFSTNTNIESKNNYNYFISRDDYVKKFNSSESDKSKFLSPLATYKSDAYLIFNQTHSNLQKSFYSLKRINSDIFNNNNECNLTTKAQIIMTGDNYKKNDSSFINIKNNYSNKAFSKIEVSLNNGKNKYSTERMKGKEKIEIIHSLNQIKNDLIQKKENKNNDNKNEDIDNEAGMTNFKLEKIDKKKINSRNNDNKDISKTEIEKIEINENIKKTDNNNYSISFDNNTYSFFSKENQNNQNTTNDNGNDNDNLLLTMDQFNNSSVVNPNKKQNSFFSHDTDINNILYQKEKNINQKKIKINKINNIEKELKNKNETIADCKNISFKKNNTIKNNNINITENLPYNEEENIIENKIPIPNPQSPFKF